MNIKERDVLYTLFMEPFESWEKLAQCCGYSIETVRKSARNLIDDGFLDEHLGVTDYARDEFASKKPRNAIILAAGFGMRMVPINHEYPKGLMEVNGEPLIERLIKQLHEVGIFKIAIVVGFLKEHFAYLTEKFDVDLIDNELYGVRNNLHSLCLAADYLSNTYIVPCDLWCDRNPFRKYELSSWYMVSELVDDDSSVRVNSRMELCTISERRAGNHMIGIAFLLDPQSQILKERLKLMDRNAKYNGAFWEEALYDNKQMIVPARVVRASDVVEINTYEQLRALDGTSNQLKSDAMTIIGQALNVDISEIVDITVLKKGMTNRSFLFSARGKKYIMRIPGEGTDQLINRRQEAAVYQSIGGRGICDNIVYINPENGYKITEFLEGTRVCDSDCVDDLKKCMKKLRGFHDLNLEVDHTFDIFQQIDFYESLWDGVPSIYKDYSKTKEAVFSLQTYINKHIDRRCLTHIDAVPDNFLFSEDGEIRLIDWEYAGMQDPHVDIAMFCIYSLYNKRQIDRLIGIYFEGDCPEEIRIKIYCYIAACGLLWSNWCEYKRQLGVEFGDYSYRQYKYARDYYKIAAEKIEEIGGATECTR